MFIIKEECMENVMDVYNIMNSIKFCGLKPGKGAPCQGILFICAVYMNSTHISDIL
jgi:hypothetical protein